MPLTQLLRKDLKKKLGFEEDRVTYWYLVVVTNFLCDIVDYGYCKVVIYKYVLCCLLFRVKFDCNLFNLVYPVFLVGICCKGCVIVKESVKTQASKARRVFASISRLSIPRKGTCALHMTGMPRVSPEGFSQVSRN